MTVAQAKAKTNLLYTGAPDTVDTDTAAAILMYFNIFKDVWFDEPNEDWNSTREVLDIGTVSATDTFDLPDEVTDISKQEGDYVTLVDSNGNKTYYTIVPANRLGTTNKQNICAVVGRTLVFRTRFLADSPFIGQTIQVPHYIRPDDYTGDNDEITVDDANFLIFMTAHELCNQDESKVNQAPRMLSYAAQSMEKMKQNNQSQAEEVYRAESFFIETGE